MKPSVWLPTVAALFASVAANAQPSLDVFAAATFTGGLQAQGIALAPSGQEFTITNTNGLVLTVPADGGVATVLTSVSVHSQETCPKLFATTVSISLRDGIFLPKTFGALAGQLLVVGGEARTSTPGYTSTVRPAASVLATPYACRAPALWSQAAVATGFGPWRG